MCSGCGSVGRAVASDTRGPQFESSHRPIFHNAHVFLLTAEKTKIKKQEAVNGPFFKKDTKLKIKMVSYFKFCQIIVQKLTGFKMPVPWVKRFRPKEFAPSCIRTHGLKRKGGKLFMIIKLMADICLGALPYN